jgi:hypothetical protein
MTPKLKFGPDIVDVILKLKADVRRLHVKTNGSARTTIESGSALLTNPVANTVLSVNINFVKAFENVPNIALGCIVSDPRQIVASTSTPTTTGFTLFALRTVAGNFTVTWIAVDSIA